MKRAPSRRTTHLRTFFMPRKSASTQIVKVFDFTVSVVLISL